MGGKVGSSVKRSFAASESTSGNSSTFSTASATGPMAWFMAPECSGSMASPFATPSLPSASRSSRSASQPLRSAEHSVGSQFWRRSAHARFQGKAPPATLKPWKSSPIGNSCKKTKSCMRRGPLA